MAVIDNRYPVFGLWFRRYAPFKRFGRVGPALGFGDFKGDNRTVSTSLGVTSRTYGVVFFNRFKVVHHFGGADKTHFSPTILNEIVGQSKVSTTVVHSTDAGPDRFGFSASTAGSMPLFPSPDINTFISVKIDVGRPNNLRIEGEAFGDNFPNLEVFIVCYRSSRTALLLDGRTPGSASTGPASRLYGSHENWSLGRFFTNLPLDSKGELAANSSVGQTKLRDYPEVLMHGYRRP